MSKCPGYYQFALVCIRDLFEDNCENLRQVILKIKKASFQSLFYRLYDLKKKKKKMKVHHWCLSCLTGMDWYQFLFSLFEWKDFTGRWGRCEDQKSERIRNCFLVFKFFFFVKVKSKEVIRWRFRGELGLYIGISEIGTRVIMKAGVFVLVHPLRANPSV